MTARTVEVAVVGAGHAGAQAAISLRNGGLRGDILMVGDEPTVPYNRPTLSKEYLLTATPPDDLFLRDEHFWVSLGVEFRSSTRAVSIDAERHLLHLSDGTDVHYRSVIVAAGGSARELSVPGADLAGVRTLRTLADATDLHAVLADTKRAVVIGGGYLGLEIASALAQSGVSITVVEALDALLKRATSHVVADYFRTLHENSGVRVILGAAVTELHAVAGAVCAVRLSDGEMVPADLVLVAAGMRPGDALLRDAGAQCADGVLVDARCRASLPDVYAIGDCARRVSEYGPADRAIRLECVQNAVASAKLAAADLLGEPFTPPGAPRFWSNQFATKFHSVGVFEGYDELSVDGDPADGSFAVEYRRSGVVIARDCVNTLAGYARLKRALEDRVLAEHRAPIGVQQSPG